MTAWTGAAAAQLSNRLPFRLRWALGIRPRNLTTNTVVPWGIWTGVRPMTFDFVEMNREFLPVGDSIRIDPIRYRVGTQVNYCNVSADMTEEAETIVRGYDTRLAPFFLWAVMFDDSSGNFLGYRRFWKGFIEGVTIQTGAQDGSPSEIAIKAASSARKGTLTRAGFKSDATQRKRSATDRFREYGDLGTVSNDSWGTD